MDEANSVFQLPYGLKGEQAGTLMSLEHEETIRLKQATFELYDSPQGTIRDLLAFDYRALRRLPGTLWVPLSVDALIAWPNPFQLWGTCIHSLRALS